MKNKAEMRDVTYVETLETENFIVEVYVNKEPRSEDEIKRSMERLVKARYRGSLKINDAKKLLE